jgi:hypothetical protein
LVIEENVTLSIIITSSSPSLLPRPWGERTNVREDVLVSKVYRIKTEQG